MTQPEPETITRRALSEELADRVRDLIISGDLKPDDKIAEAELCDRFGVSRTPLREAVKMLAAEGLVTLTPNRGARISSITAEEIAELFPIMGALEAMAGELVIQRMTGGDQMDLLALHDEIVATRTNNDWVGYSRANRAFHATLFRIARNDSLTLIYNQLMIRTHAVRFVAQQTPKAWDAAVRDHEKIIAAIIDMDENTIGPLLKQHLARKAEGVIATLTAGKKRPRHSA